MVCWKDAATLTSWRDVLKCNKAHIFNRINNKETFYSSFWVKLFKRYNM